LAEATEATEDAIEEREEARMAEDPNDATGDERDPNERNGDLASILYVLGGIPALIAFFLILFLLTGSCDQSNIMIPA
jgi:hypothetical protein